jgi:hypothetical protein
MSIDRGYGADSMGVHAAVPYMDGGRETATLLVEKFDLDMTRWAQRRLGVPRRVTIPRSTFRRLKIRPFETVEAAGNLMTTAGWGQLFKSILGGSPTLFSATVGRIGIGSGSVAAVSTDTALGSISTNGGLTGNNWVLCGVAPTDSTAATPCTSVFTASFGTSAAVGEWNEWAIDQGTASAGPTVTATAPMMNHAVPGVGVIGTKGSATWTATATLSFT